MIDTGPPIALIAVGLVLWLAIDATLAGISIQTIGVILAVVGVIWLLIELFQASGRRRHVVAREEPVVVRERQREIY
jgi:membrane-bound ClpP family serine protease